MKPTDATNNNPPLDYDTRDRLAARWGLPTVEQQQHDRREAQLAEIERIEDLYRAWNDKAPTSEQESEHYREFLRNWNN